MVASCHKMSLEHFAFGDNLWLYRASMPVFSLTRLCGSQCKIYEEHIAYVDRVTFGRTVLGND